jgi:hypothetical protein
MPLYGLVSLKIRENHNVPQISWNIQSGNFGLIPAKQSGNGSQKFPAIFKKTGIV